MARKLLVMVLCMFFLYISGDTVGIFIQALQQDQQPATAGSQTNTVENSGLQGKLVFAHVLYRHGDRTPLDPYPNDPWNKREFWPTGWGQLTNTGKQQHYELGQWLRQRYGSLLGTQYDRNDIYIRSTDVDRTLMSAESNLAGLYEPVNGDVWNKDIKWQPIPVHTVPEQYDYVLAAKRSCAAYDFARSELDTSPEFIKLYDRYNYLFKYLTEYSGRNVESFEQICYLNNTLFIESLYNLALPEWTKKVYPSPDMTFAADFAFVIPTYTRKMARLKAGPLMKEIFDRFSEKAKGTLNPDRALWVYSAHDTTVANVLNTLKLFDPHCPPYAATILMELRLDDKQQPFVSFFYKNTTAEPAPLYIPDCGTECPLDKLYKIYDDILPRDWEQECKLSTMLMTYDQANIGLASGILIAILLTTLVLSYVLMIYYRRRSYRTYLAYTQVA